MGKFHGVIGYSVPIQTEAGVFRTDVQIVERNVYGDELQASSKWVEGRNVNDDLKVNTKISIIADAYAMQHFSQIKYCVWMGIKWKVIEIQPKRPRLILTLGGEYNGE